jgi:hypothetical protein
VDGVGERLVRTLLTLWDTPGSFAPFLALVRGAVGSEAAATMLREFLTREVLGRIAAIAAPDRPALRAKRRGLADRRAGDGALHRPHRRPSDADREEVVAAIGPTIQRYLTGPI